MCKRERNTHLWTPMVEQYIVYVLHNMEKEGYTRMGYICIFELWNIVEMRMLQMIQDFSEKAGVAKLLVSLITKRNCMKIKGNRHRWGYKSAAVQQAYK